MPINVDIKVVPFGQINMEIGKPAPSIKEQPAITAQEEVRYCEPQESASRIYDVRYEKGLKNYTVPLSTG